MMRALPRLGLLFVALGTGIRADDLGRIRRNRVFRGKAEDYHQAAQTEGGGPERGPGHEPDRPKTIRSRYDNDFSPLFQPYTPAWTFFADRGCDRSRAGVSAGWWA